MFLQTDNPDLIESQAEAVVPPPQQQQQQQGEGNGEKPKRNCGRTGPTSAQGLFVSSQNARRHGGCSKTLILPDEFEQDWLDLLARWLKNYKNPDEDSLTYDFVLTAAQADWYRRRNQRFFDELIMGTGGLPPWSMQPGDAKQYDLMLRYKTTAERAFQREFRNLEVHWKSVNQQNPPAKSGTPEPAQPQQPLKMLPMPTPIGRTGAEIRAKNEKYGWNRPFLEFHEEPETPGSNPTPNLSGGRT